MKKCGRPPKAENPVENRKKIIDAAVALIKTHGADCVTVRRVCEQAGLATGTFYYYFQNKDDLLMHFVRETSFADLVLATPADDVAGRVIELYAHLLRRYTDFGAQFMKIFYTADNRALHAYMDEVDGQFAPDTIMARCERELAAAQQTGHINNGANVRTMSADICTVAKGCIFEWCLSGGKTDITAAFARIVRCYLTDKMP